MGGYPYKRYSLSSVIVVGVSRVYAGDLSNDFDEEDILSVYAKNLFIDLKDERDTSPKKHDQR
jgi:hypothetical protein